MKRNHTYQEKPCNWQQPYKRERALQKIFLNFRKLSQIGVLLTNLEYILANSVEIAMRQFCFSVILL